MQEQFGYAYDAAWNLNWRTNDQFKQQFQVNNRNELTGSSRSGTLTVSGTAGLRKSQWEWDAGVTNVTVSGTGLSSGSADLYEDGSWARRGATLQNGNNSYTALAKDTLGRESTDTVSVYAPASVTFTYDLNGNLTGDGLRVFEYDYENQLTNVYVANQWKSEFAYDALMRRRVRKEFTWSGSAWVKTNEVRYVYDGRLVIQERDENNVPRVTYTRGLDLSGSLEGAGGIGGLLARSESLSSVASGGGGSTSYYHSDASGNVTCMVDTTGTVVARYTYDPYGNVLSMSGSLAEANLYRFSSKEAHVNSGLVYYLYRYYEPNLQRWINQDPIGERGGLNLPSFAMNDPISDIDAFGECPLANPMNAEAYAPGSTFFSGHGDVTPKEYFQFVGGSILAYAGATAALGVVIEAAAPTILTSLGVGGGAVKTPKGQQMVQNVSQLINNLTKEIKSLERALWEDRVALDNARRQIANILDRGGRPNPHGLMQDLKSFEEGVAAKEKAIRLLEEQLSNLQCKGK